MTETVPQHGGGLITHRQHNSNTSSRYQLSGVSSLDLNGILDNIQDYDEYKTLEEKEDSTIHCQNITPLKTENEHLKRKIETLHNLVNEYTTKHKELEMKLQHEYNQKEEDYLLQIEQLKHQIKTQHLKLYTLEKQSRTNLLDKSLVDLPPKKEKHGDHNQKLETLSIQIAEQNKKLDVIQRENIDLRNINMEHSNKIMHQSSQIELLQKMSTKFIRKESPVAIHVRELQKSTTGNMSRSLQLQKSATGNISRSLQKSATGNWSASQTQDSVKIVEYTNVMPTLLQLPTAFPLRENTELSFENELQVRNDDAFTKTQIYGSSAMGLSIEEQVTQKGKLIIKQMPYTTQSHIFVNVVVKIVTNLVLNLVAYVDRRCNVKQFIDLLEQSHIIQQNLMDDDHEMHVFCADDDGELSSDETVLDHKQIISELGIMNFYVKIIYNEKQEEIEIVYDKPEYNLFHTLSYDNEENVDNDASPRGGSCYGKCVIV